jgi:hypothetical protein
MFIGMKQAYRHYSSNRYADINKNTEALFLFTVLKIKFLNMSAKWKRKIFLHYFYIA